MFSFTAMDVGTIQEHRHRSYQVNFSIDRPNSYVVDQQQLENVYGIVIDHDTWHSCDYRDSNIVVCYIYPASILGKRLKVMLEGRGHRILPRFNSMGNNVLPEGYWEMPVPDQGLLIKEYLLDLLYSEKVFVAPLNGRVRLALDFIEKNLHGRMGNVIKLRFLVLVINPLSPIRSFDNSYRGGICPFSVSV